MLLSTSSSPPILRSACTNEPKEAIDLYTELKTKYAATQRGFEADKFLAQLGVYSDDKK
jgi:hypothetical protein